MSDAYSQGMSLMQRGRYDKASEFFSKSYRQGFLPWESLLYYSNCKFMLAGELPGKGMLTGLPRRSLLISASTALRDGLQEFGETSDYLHLACCVEYALGVLISGSGTTQYDAYYQRLSRLDKDMLHQLNSDLPHIRVAFG